MEEQLTSEQQDAIVAALASGQKIEAIKLYREATGEGLKEAKSFVDAYSLKLAEQDPEKFQKLAAGKGSGCAALVIALFSLGLGLSWYLGQLS